MSEKCVDYHLRLDSLRRRFRIDNLSMWTNPNGLRLNMTLILLDCWSNMALVCSYTHRLRLYWSESAVAISHFNTLIWMTIALTFAQKSRQYKWTFIPSQFSFKLNWIYKYRMRVFACKFCLVWTKPNLTQHELTWDDPSSIRNVGDD